MLSLAARVSLPPHLALGSSAARPSRTVCYPDSTIGLRSEPLPVKTMLITRPQAAREPNIPLRIGRASFDRSSRKCQPPRRAGDQQKLPKCPHTPRTAMRLTTRLGEVIVARSGAAREPWPIGAAPGWRQSATSVSGQGGRRQWTTT